MSGWDAAGWMLAAAVRLLPRGRREWGAAMRAELAGLGARGERWRFTLGCVWVVVTRPAVWRRIGFALAALAVVIVTVGETGRVGYAPLRWGLAGMVATLVGVVWLGRVRPLGPVGEGRAARGLRAGGCLLVGVYAAFTIVQMVRNGNPGDQAHAAPVLTVVFAGYLLGLLALTARRSRAGGPALVAGVAAGGAAAAVWTGTVLLAPPVPDDVTPAVTLIALGMAIVAGVAARRGAALGSGLAAMCAGTVASLLILDVVAVVSALGPARLIPDLAPAALTRADDLAQSRVELADPYLWLLLFGLLIAVGQGVVSLATRRPAGTAAGSVPPEVR